MGFQDKTNPVQVGNATDPNGKTEPLDVLDYGGQLIYTAVFTGNGFHTVLNAPPTGQLYRLHRISLSLVPAGETLLTGLTSGADYHVAQQGGSADFQGQLVGEALQISSPSATGAYRVTLTYDLVTPPDIS